MKKKMLVAKVVLILSLVLLMLLLFFPIKAYLDDGGSVIYASISGVYKVTKIKTYGNIGMTLTMKEGLRVELFGKEVYYKIDKEYPVGVLPETDEETAPYDGGEIWRGYTETPYSSTLLMDGQGTAELLLDKTLEAYPVDMAADDILAAVKESNYVVFEDSRLATGGIYWQEFYKKVQKKENAQVKLVKYYTLGDESRYAPEYYAEIKDEYPKLFFISLVYVADEGFYVNARPGTEAEPEAETQYFKYLKHFEGDAPTASATFSRYDRYVLVDDNTATWEEIEHRMFSSVILEDAVSWRWREVYCNLVN